MAGPDEIAPDLLKHLPADFEVELLKILNHSWLEGWCPQSWRDVVIIPFLKKDRPTVGRQLPAHCPHINDLQAT